MNNSGTIDAGFDFSSFQGRKQPIEIQTPFEAELQAIDKSITRRYLGGKFVGGVNIHGEEFAPPSHNLENYDDFQTLPKNEETKAHSFSAVVQQFDPRLSILSLSYYTNKLEKHAPKGIDVENGLVVTKVTDINDPGLVHSILNMRDTNRDYKGRDTLFTNAYFRLPIMDWVKLEESGLKEPSIWERFIQIAFKGIDNATTRVPRTGVTVVDATKLIPEDLVRGLRIYPNQKFRKFIWNDMYEVLATQKSKLDLSAITHRPFAVPLPIFR